MVTKKKKTDIATKDDMGPTMHQFICEKCKTKYFDTRRYFGEPPTKMCLWCTKYPIIKGKR